MGGASPRGDRLAGVPELADATRKTWMRRLGERLTDSGEVEPLAESGLRGVLKRLLAAPARSRVSS